MARPTITFRSSIYSTTNSSPYTASTAWTPAANGGVVAFVVNTVTTGSAPDPTSVSAHGIALTQIGPTLAISTTDKLSVWAGTVGASPTNAAASATIGGSPTGAAVIEFEIANFNGSDLLAAIRQVATASGTAVSGSIAVPRDAAVTDAAGWMSLLVHLANEATTGQGGNWTQTANASGSFNLPATAASGQFNVTGYTATATASWTTSSAWAGIAVLIDGSTEVRPSETLHLSDGPVLARTNPDSILLPTETLHIQDTWVIPPLSVQVATETLHVVDVNQGVVQLIGVLHIQDGPVVAALAGAAGDLSASLTETLHVQDTHADNAAGLDLDEFLHISDGPVIARTNPDAILLATETLHVQDTVTASIATVLIEAAPSAETLHLSDGPASARTNPDAIILSVETLHVQDTVTASIATGLIQAQAADETLHLVDGPVSARTNPDAITLTIEAVHVQDSIVAVVDASLVVSSELLHVADTLTAAMDLQPAVAPSESLRLTDTVIAQVDPMLVALAAESLHVADTLTLQQDPLVTSPSELLHVQDSVSAQTVTALNAAISDETLHVSDSVAARTNPDAIGLPEALRVQDTLTAQLTPLQVVLATETLHVSDTLTAQTDPLIASSSELLHATDIVSASVDLSVQAPGESLRVSEGLAARTNPDAIGLTESVRVQDAVTAQRVTLVLEAAAAEALTLSDVLQATRIDGSALNVVLTETLHLHEAVRINAKLLLFRVTLAQRLNRTVALATRLEKRLMIRKILAKTVKMTSLLSVRARTHGN